MIAVIFEFTAAEGRFADYKQPAEALGEEVGKFDGFISIERFQSISDSARFVSLSFWRDEEAVRKWRNVRKHREAQAKGRAGSSAPIACAFAKFCATTECGAAPRRQDSIAVHG